MRHFCWSLVLVLQLFVVSCSRRDAFDPRTVETDAGAALVRQLIADCPHHSDTRKMCLTLGPDQAPASEAFLGRFPDLKPRFLKHNQVTVLSLNGKTRVLEKSTGMTTGDLVLLMQVSDMVSAGGKFQAVAAWAYKDDMMRRKYTITPEADGKFKVEAGEIIEQKPQPGV